MIDRRTFLAATAAAFASACSGGGSPRQTPDSSAATSARPSAGASTATTLASATTTAPATTVRAPGAPSLFVARAGTARNQVGLTFHTDGDLRIAQRLLDGLAGRAQITC